MSFVAVFGEQSTLKGSCYIKRSRAQFQSLTLLSSSHPSLGADIPIREQMSSPRCVVQNRHSVHGALSLSWRHQRRSDEIKLEIAWPLERKRTLEDGNGREVAKVNITRSRRVFSCVSRACSKVQSLPLLLSALAQHKLSTAAKQVRAGCYVPRQVQSDMFRY